jgi:hypothetical protein
LPSMMTTVLARADSGFYCQAAVEAYPRRGCGFIVVARKTAPLLAQLRAAEWRRSRRTDADQECEFRYPPDGFVRHAGIYLPGVCDEPGGPGV